MQKIILAFFTTIFVLSACSKKPDAPTPVNLPPSDFSISIVEIKQTTAILSWTAAKDPEGQQVLYTVAVGADTVSRNLTSTQIQLNNLEENKKYDVTVIAVDPKGSTAKQAISFTTTVYSNPSAFVVSTVQIGGSIASISWTSSVLADGTPVKYDVYLNDVLVKENLADTAKNYSFKLLKEFTTYTAKVIAKSIYNKTQTSTKQFTTIEDPKPAGLAVQVKLVSYSILKFAIDSATDIEGQGIRYSVYLDNVDVSAQLEAIVKTNKDYILRTLLPLKSYVLKVVATDDGGKFISQEKIAVTLKQPILVMDTKTITKTATGFIYNLLTDVDYKPSKIILYANGVAITTQPQVSSIVGSNTISYTYTNSVFASQGAYSIAANLFWGDDTEMSRTATFNTYSFYNFTPTSVAVSEAKIDAASGNKPYTIFFQNYTISPYSGYSIIEVVFGEQNVPFTIFRTGDLTGYLTEFTSGQFALINAGPRTGYVIMKDTGGYHKLDFVFSYW